MTTPAKRASPAKSAANAPSIRSSGAGRLWITRFPAIGLVECSPDTSGSPDEAATTPPASTVVARRGSKKITGPGPPKLAIPVTTCDPPAGGR